MDRELLRYITKLWSDPDTERDFFSCRAGNIF